MDKIKEGYKVEYNGNIYTIESIITHPETFVESIIIKNNNESFCLEQNDSAIKYLDEIDKSCILMGDTVLYEDKKYKVEIKMPSSTIGEYFYVLTNETNQYVEVSPHNSNKIIKL
mgnify:CR=1 FL=1